MRNILGNLFTAVFAAVVASVIVSGAMADQFKYGTRVTQLGDIVPQSTAQATLNFSPVFGAGFTYGSGPIVQATAAAITKKVTMVAGVATLTFPAFTLPPICGAQPEGSDSSATANSYLVATTTSCAYHSGDSADTRVVDFQPPIGNPN